MLEISSDLINYKNLLVDTGAWLILIEIVGRDGKPLADEIRICSNTEIVEWPTGSGKNWTPYPFVLDSFGENSKAEVPTTSLKICNIDGILNNLVEQYNGFRSCIVIVRVIHSKSLTSANVPTYKFKIKAPVITSQWVVFSMGGVSLFSKQDPAYKMNRTFCRYRKRLNDDMCGYSREYTLLNPSAPTHGQTCDGTLIRCRELGRSLKFGGFPGMASNDVYTS